MRRLIVLVLILVCIHTLVGCNKTSMSEAVVVGSDQRPMVMIDGTLYLDTNQTSIRTERNDGFDGEITSTVERSQIPTENNQSNFGSGYGYQYGTHGTIEIFINEKWIVFEAEAPNDSNSQAIAAHFYLDGKGYFYNGATYELPEGYEYAGDVINVGNTFSGKDFEGNVDGKVYMNPSVSDTAYFSWAEWNEEVDGPAPFLKLKVKRNS